MIERAQTLEKTCESCKYWSDKCAMSIGCGPMEALCLSEESPRRGRFSKENDYCDQWEGGVPVDRE